VLSLPHRAHLADQTFTIVVDVSGMLPSVQEADCVSKWLQTAIVEKGERLDDAPRRH